MAKNVVIVVALLAAGFFAAYLRFQPHLGLTAAYTDGVHTYDSVTGEESIRFAVWDDAEALTDAVNSESSEHGPAISPDGELFVFVSGEAGLNADLYVAEMERGELKDARPLFELNTDFDELAPAFSGSALYFATNRVGGEGGLDLWRSAYDSGSFGEPEALGGGLNTAADESDPAPLTGSRALAFASNREGDWDLYIARPAEAVSAGESAPEWGVESFETVNSPFDDREPCFASNGLGMVLSSDRPGGAGGFDLWRSVQRDGAWLPAESIPGVGSEADERSPLSSRDGFTLYYSSNQDGESGNLYRAGSRELFRLPGRPIGILDLIILASLMLAALLAWLAKRWQQLEILYKCFVTSVALHFALLFWFQGVGVEPGISEFPERAALFSVHLAATGDPRRGLEERGDRLELERGALGKRHELERASSDSSFSTSVTASEAALALAVGPTPSSPSRSEREAPSPQFEAQSEVPITERELPAPRRIADATAFDHEVSLTAGERREPETVSLSRTENLPRSGALSSTPVDLLSSLAQRRSAVELESRGFADDGGAPVRVPNAAINEPAPRSIEQVVSVRQPTEAFELRSAISADPARLQLPIPSRASVAERPPRADSFEPSRTDSGALEVVEPSSAESVVADALTGKLESRRSDVPELLPDREQSLATPIVARDTPKRAVEVRQPTERPVRRAETAAFRAVQNELVPSKRAWSERERQTEQPSRLKTAVEVELAPRPSRRQLLAKEERIDDRDRVIAERLERTPYRSRFGLEKSRALSEHGGGEATEVAVASGLAYLAEKQNSSGGWGRPGLSQEKYFEVGVGKSALALLAFLGAGHTPESESVYSELTDRAVRFLLAQQDEESGHFGYSSSYSHGIATYALAECFALTGSPKLREPLERAVLQILRKQDQRSGKRQGGWGYYYPDGRGSDGWPRVSVSSWQVMALESARLGGIEVPRESFDRARQFLTSSYDSRGWFRYSQDPARLNSAYATLPGSTPAALFALSVLGEELEDSRWDDALDFISSRAPDGYRFTSDDAFVYRARGNLYFWYYSTLAMFRRGGSQWDRWNAAMKETLLDAQSEDGSWKPISVYANYAGDEENDRSYSTAMCVLTLEIYYRYFTPLLAIE